MEVKKDRQYCKIQILEWKVAVLTKVIEERLGLAIDFRDEVEKFIDDFLSEV